MIEPTQEVLTLAEEYFNATESFNRVSSEKKDAENHLKEVGRKLYQKMEQTGLQSFRHKTFGKIYLSGRPYCKITDSEKAEKFLKAAGIYNEVMYLTEHRSRLNSFIVDNYIEKGIPFPESESGIFVAVTPIIRKTQGGLNPQKAQEWRIKSEGI